MVRVKVEVKGSREVEREIKRYRNRLGLKTGEFADLAAKAVRDTVVRNAQPFGVGKKAREQGENAIRGDLVKIFQPVPETARGRRGVIVSVSQARRWHDMRRNNRGRTIRGEKKRILVSVFRAYLGDVLKRVGVAKASVMGGDDPRLKGRFQNWIKKSRKYGSAGRRRGVSGAVWKFRAEPKHVASDGVLGRRGVARVFRNKNRNLLNVLKRAERKRLKDLEKRANRRN